MEQIEQTLFVGLGNPGEKYSDTRHNAGFLFVDYLATLLNAKFLDKKRWQAQIAEPDRTISLVKPQTFMNASGQAVRSIVAFYKINPESMFVAFDDLDLEQGTGKVQFGRGPKSHNGLNSIYQELGTDQFWHIRIGIDGRSGDKTVPPDAYVLQKMSVEERDTLQKNFRALKDNMMSRNLVQHRALRVQ